MTNPNETTWTAEDTERLAAPKLLQLDPSTWSLRSRAAAEITRLQARVAELEEAERVRREGHAAKVGAFKERLKDPGYAKLAWDNLAAALNAPPQDADQAAFESGYDHGFAEADRDANKRIAALEAQLADAIPRAELVEALTNRSNARFREWKAEPGDDALIFGAYTELDRVLAEVEAGTFPPKEKT